MLKLDKPSTTDAFATYLPTSILIGEASMIINFLDSSSLERFMPKFKAEVFIERGDSSNVR